MSDDRGELEAVMRGMVEDERWGPHPEPEALAEFALGALEGEEADRLRSHLALCPECMALAEEAASFAPRDAETGAEEAEIDAAWRALAPRLAPGAATAPVVPLASRRPAAPPRWLYALAASLGVAVLGLSVWVASLRQAVEDLSQPQVNAPIVDLYPEGAARSAAEERGELELPASVRWFSLVLNAPGSPDDASYRVEVRRQDGSVVWRGLGLEKNAFGSFTLAVPRAVVGSGEVRVRLLVAEAGGSERLIEEYPLRIVERGP